MIYEVHPPNQKPAPYTTRFGTTICSRILCSTGGPQVSASTLKKTGRSECLSISTASSESAQSPSN